MLEHWDSNRIAMGENYGGFSITWDICLRTRFDRSDARDFLFPALMLTKLGITHLNRCLVPPGRTIVDGASMDRGTPSMVGRQGRVRVAGVQWTVGLIAPLVFVLPRTVGGALGVLSDFDRGFCVIVARVKPLKFFPLPALVVGTDLTVVVAQRGVALFDLILVLPAFAIDVGGAIGVVGDRDPLRALGIVTTGITIGLRIAIDVAL